LKVKTLNFILVYTAVIFFLLIYCASSGIIGLEIFLSFSYLLFCINFPTIFFLKNNYKDWFSPIIYFSAFYTLSYVFFPLVYETLYVPVGLSTFYFDGIQVTDWVAIVVLGLGILFFYCGLILTKPNSMEFNPSIDITLKIPGKWIILFYSLITFFRIIEIYNGSRGSLVLLDQGYNESSSQLKSVIIFLSNYWFIYLSLIYFLVKERKIEAHWSYIFICLEIIIITLEGNRRQYLNLFSIPFLYSIYYLKRNPIIKSKTLFTGLFFILLFIFATLYGFYLIVSDSSNSFLIYIQNVPMDDLVKRISQSVTESFNSMFVYLESTRKFEGDWGMVGIKNLLQQLLPSFMIDDKYLYTRQFENLFADKLQRINIKNSYLSINQPSALFLSFNYYGVILGYFCWGLVLGLILKMFQSSFFKTYSLPIFISLIFFLSLYLNSSLIGGDIVFILRLLIYLFFINLFLKLKI